MTDGKRPDIWIGHVVLRTPRLAETETCLLAIGLRPVFKGDNVRILELRGGTHIAVLGEDDAEPVDVPYDFMVEDLAASHRQFTDQGLNVGPIEEGDIHTSFVLTEPGGNRITVNSTHVEDHSLV